MTRIAAALAALLALAGAVNAQSVKLPDVKGDPGTIIVVKAETDCSTLKWVVLDPGLTMIPPDLLKDSKTAVVMAGKAGKYRLLAYGALKDSVSEPAIGVVTVGEPGPPPPPPPPPPPVDQLTQALQVAYLSDTAPDRADSLARLTAVFGQADAAYTANPKFTTWGTLLDAMHSAAENMLPGGKLKTVRQTIATELKKSLPAADKTLDADGRKLAADTFQRIATALKGVK